MSLKYSSVNIVFLKQTKNTHKHKLAMPKNREGDVAWFTPGRPDDVPLDAQQHQALRQMGINPPKFVSGNPQTGVHIKPGVPGVRPDEAWRNVIYAAAPNHRFNQGRAIRENEGKDRLLGQRVGKQGLGRRGGCRKCSGGTRFVICVRGDC